MTLFASTNPDAVLFHPLRITHGAQQLGRALWLYLLLLRHANEHGLVVRSRAHLANDLTVSESTIDEWLDRLMNAKLVRVLSPSPYLALRLDLWSGSGSESGNSALSHMSALGSRSSSKLQQHAAADPSSNGDRGPGEGAPSDEEIRGILRDPDVDIATLVGSARSTVIRKALSRVRATPDAQIRKSRTALFRYLIHEFSQELDIDEL